MRRVPSDRAASRGWRSSREDPVGPAIPELAAGANPETPDSPRAPHQSGCRTPPETATSFCSSSFNSLPRSFNCRVNIAAVRVEFSLLIELLHVAGCFCISFGSVARRKHAAAESQSSAAKVKSPVSCIMTDPWRSRVEARVQSVPCRFGRISDTSLRRESWRMMSFEELSSSWRYSSVVVSRGHVCKPSVRFRGVTRAIMVTLTPSLPQVRG